MGFGEWIGLIALVVGLMALPTVFQMFYGRPKLDFEFSVVLGEKASALQCKIFNKPVSNWGLRKLGVRRENAHIHAAYKIWHAETNALVIPLTVPTIVCREKQATELDLSASIVGASFGVALITDSGFFPLENNKPADARANPLAPGTYRFPLVVWNGEETIAITREFVVTERARDSYWVI